MVSDRLVGKHVSEYPDGRSDNHDPRVIPKNPRNKPCASGSGKKFKHCHA